jgi:hypothetical protein
VSLVKAGPLLGTLLFLWLHERDVFRLIGTATAQTAAPAPAPALAPGVVA